LPHILGVTYDGVRHAMPLVTCDPYQLELLLERADCLYPLAQATLADARCDGMYISWNEDDSDYIYSAKRLATLSGAKMRVKRREAAAFEAIARPCLHSLNMDNRQQAYEVLELWRDQVGRCNRETDYAACREALDEFDMLNLGGVLTTDSLGRPCAFLLWSRLAGGTVAVHFAKGDRNMAGVYPHLFSRFADRAQAEWLNFEQDLGKPGLRQAKRALDPLHRLRKFRLSRIPPIAAHVSTV
jgi:uncharacterized protein